MIMTNFEEISYQSSMIQVILVPSLAYFPIEVTLTVNCLGYFPALLKNGSAKSYYFRNGGVPQQGDLSQHLQIFQKQMQDLIPDLDYAGM